jgi:hypothetical protein
VTSSCALKARTIEIDHGDGGIIGIFEVQAFNPSGDEIAQNKAASQSSTLRSFDASNAVDGDMSSFSHTDRVDGPVWWKVDLENEQDVQSVKIRNRWCRDASDGPGCLCRLSGATLKLIDSQGAVIESQSIGDTCNEHVLSFEFSCPPNNSSPPSQSPTVGTTSPPSTSPTVGTTSSTSQSPTSQSPTVGTTSSTSQSPTSTSPTVGTTSCSPPKARKIKIDHGSETIINMREVQVFNPSGDEIAQNKAASQSSTFRSFSASNAVDGDANSFSHTDNVDGPVWWEVDLGNEQDIRSVEIMNRYCRGVTDAPGCLCRLSDATLNLIDEEGVVTASRPLGNTCGELTLLLDFSCPTSEIGG